MSQKLSTSHPTLTSSCVALSPSAAAEEACVDEAFFDDEALWLRRSGRAEAAVVEEKRLRLRIFFLRWRRSKKSSCCRPLERESPLKCSSVPSSFLFNAPGPGEESTRPARLEEGGRRVLFSRKREIENKRMKRKCQREQKKRPASRRRHRWSSSSGVCIFRVTPHSYAIAFCVPGYASSMSERRIPGYVRLIAGAP